MWQQQQQQQLRHFSKAVVSGLRYSNQHDIVVDLLGRGLITYDRTAEVMARIDRAHFTQMYVGVPASTAYMVSGSAYPVLGN